jgi:hypothetical protein
MTKLFAAVATAMIGAPSFAIAYWYPKREIDNRESLPVPAVLLTDEPPPSHAIARSPLAITANMNDDY